MTNWWTLRGLRCRQRLVLQPGLRVLAYPVYPGRREDQVVRANLVFLQVRRGRAHQPVQADLDRLAGQTRHRTR